MFMNANKPYTVKTLKEELANMPDDLPIELAIANLTHVASKAVIADRNKELYSINPVYLSHFGNNANKTCVLLFSEKEEFTGWSDC